MVQAVRSIERATNPQRILVTGGAGFIGSHLTRRLLGLGHQVTVADSFTTGLAGNLSDVADQPGLTLIEHDIIDPLYLDVTQIYHLACPASPVHYQADPIKTLKTCVFGSVNMLGLARRTGATVLLASTSEVYGDPTVHPQAETYRGNVNPIGPRACYDEGKRCAEAAFFCYRDEFDLPIKVARIFNTYGPGMRPDDGRVVSNFIMRALHGEPLIIAGDGTHTRSFCYVDDLVDGLIRLMNTPHAVTGPINLGNPEECTIAELAELVIATVGEGGAVGHGPLPQDDPVRRKPVIDLADAVLGWQPTTPLADGLVATAEFFRRLESERGRSEAALSEAASEVRR